MIRLFVRVLVGIVLAFLLSTLIWGQLVLRADIGEDGHPYEHFYAGPASLVVDRLRDTPEPLRTAELERLSGRFGFPIRIVSWNDARVDSEARTLLEQGRAVTGWYAPEEGTLFASILAPQQQLVLLGPLRGSRPPSTMRQVVAVLLIAAVWVLTSVLLLRPVLRQLSGLERAAERIRSGDFQARVDPALAAALPLARTFNAMASETERLITAQRHLLHAVSHELRTPLARLHFGVEALAAAADEETRQGRLLETVRDIEELDSLVGELLAYARVEHTAGAASMERVDMGDLFRQLASEHASSATPRTELDWKGGEIFADRRLLHRALANVVRNARRHARSRVHVSGGVDASVARIMIDDDGCGIPPSDAERVFEPFVRLSNSAQSDGVGLGLPIVRKILRAHGGDARIDVSPMGGCRVVLEWPHRPGALP